MTTWPKVFAVDPGPSASALVVLDGDRIERHERCANTELLQVLGNSIGNHVLVVEQIASMGMAVGADVFETCVWTGRFIQAWSGLVPIMPWDRVKRHEVKTALCGSQRAKDPNIRQALIDRFGPGKDRAIGSKTKPGPLYGIAGDEWSALAVAVVWQERTKHGR
jgi:hypothetical protein